MISRWSLFRLYKAHRCMAGAPSLSSCASARGDFVHVRHFLLARLMSHKLIAYHDRCMLSPFSSDAKSGPPLHTLQTIAQVWWAKGLTAWATNGTRTWPRAHQTRALGTPETSSLHQILGLREVGGLELASKRHILFSFHRDALRGQKASTSLFVCLWLWLGFSQRIYKQSICKSLHCFGSFFHMCRGLT